MFEKPTVFILGAGASVPYAYPTGFQLQEDIKQLLINVPEPGVQGFIPCESHPYNPALWDELGYDREKLRNLFNDLSHAATYSIDKFLERKPVHIALGKLLIAYTLKKKEYVHNLHIELRKSNWYAELINRLDLAPENMDDLKISFVTFNYDRSLEYFFYHLLKNRSVDEKKAVEAFKKIEIVHVYGGFGNFPWEKDGIPYDRAITPAILKRLAEGIKIMSDERETTDDLKNARRLIEKAGNIYFIGFGYDQDNLKRLNMPYNSVINAGKAGTTVGLSHSDRNRMESHFHGGMFLAPSNMDIMQFLEQAIEYR